MARPKPNREALGLTGASAETGATLDPVAQIAEDYRRTFSDSSGAAVLEDLRKSYGDRRSFVPDSNRTAFHEGQRDVYLMILSRMNREVNRAPKETDE